MLMLLFYVGNDCYCCSCEPIIEIIPKILLKQIPQAPTYLAGIFNYGGDPVPVVDLSKIILGVPSKNKLHTRIIIIKNPTQTPIKVLGLIAERMIETRDIDPKLFNALGLPMNKLPFLDGVYNSTNESILQININHLFTSLSKYEIPCE